MRRCLLIVLLGLIAVPAAHATPREITVDVGERDGIRLLSNDRKGWHWYWLRRPDARIAKPDPPQMLPENDEAVNGLSGRTSVTVLGVRPGVTSGTVGYWNANRTRLFKTVRIRIVVQ